ncbi:MAG: glycoside hydrolase family 57 protein [Candidatus Cryptobacteroides sp.]|nr:glycoside hydrolase family 57 protein [Candidatus Cryptobacteroides sp.]
MATKSICLYFQVHQPTRLRLYRFFDIGKDSHYYDDFANRTILRRVAQKCYLPMNQQMLELINKNKGKFKICYSISGSALEQFQRFCPEVIASFKALADTGKVEFLAETYYHSLASLANESEFRAQVEKHAAKIEELFGVKPTAFRNTELIYSNGIGEMVYDMGYKTMLTEGARHIMGWRSPNYVYTGETQPKLKLLLRNYTLSDDIAFRFSQNKVTAEQYVGWLKDNAKEGDIVNLFMDYETFGEHQGAESGIFDFMRELPAAVIKDGTFSFVTPSEATKKYKAVSDIAVDDPISWADEERDLTAWLGNELQNEAFKKVYAMTEKLSIVNDPELWEDFGHLQESDHFYYMCTKFFSDGEVHKYFNPYDTPYEAFINYMNVISDFQIRLDEKRAALDVKETVAEELGAKKRKKK